MHRTNIYLDEEQSEQLDQLAAQEGVSRAELIRRLLARALAGTDHDLEVDLAAIKSSFGVLADAAPVERGHDARGEHLDHMWRLGA
jgi:metal-responsive CopG/Arc/MetJ family transcriptional regulator